jgi:hypothetical protein
MLLRSFIYTEVSCTLIIHTINSSDAQYILYMVSTPLLRPYVHVIYTPIKVCNYMVSTPLIRPNRHGIYTPDKTIHGIYATTQTLST